MFSAACPAVKVTAPIGVDPSRKMTEPAGVPVPGATRLTIAVNESDCPKTEGLAEPDNAVVVEANGVALPAVERATTSGLIAVTVGSSTLIWPVCAAPDGAGNPTLMVHVATVFVQLSVSVEPADCFYPAEQGHARVTRAHCHCTRSAQKGWRH